MNSAPVVADCSFVGLFELGTNLGDIMPTRIIALIDPRTSNIRDSLKCSDVLPVNSRTHKQKSLLTISNLPVDPRNRSSSFCFVNY